MIPNAALSEQVQDATARVEIRHAARAAACTSVRVAGQVAAQRRARVLESQVARCVVLSGMNSPARRDSRARTNLIFLRDADC